MTPYPLHTTRYEDRNGVDHVVTVCPKCGKTWRRRTARRPKLIPVSSPKPFHCPKCGTKVADNTGYF